MPAWTAKITAPHRARLGRGVARWLRVAVAVTAAGLAGCNDADVPDPAADPVMTPPRESPVDADDFLDRVEVCRESLSNLVTENWRDVQEHFNEDGTLKSPRRAHFFPLASPTSRLCDQLMRDERREGPLRVLDLERVERLTAISRMYAVDAAVLDAATVTPGVQRDEIALVESTYGHMRALLREWEITDVALEFHLRQQQGVNDQALIEYFDARGESLRKSQVLLVQALRRFRRCYTDPQPPLECELATDRLRAAAEAFLQPEEDATSREVAIARGKVFWLSTFEDDARILLRILDRTPPAIRTRDKVTRLANDPVVDAAVLRLLRDARTLAFDFP